jgi:hypothetical protein
MGSGFGLRVAGGGSISFQIAACNELCRVNLARPSVHHRPRTRPRPRPRRRCTFFDFEDDLIKTELLILESRTPQPATRNAQHC